MFGKLSPFRLQGAPHTRARGAMLSGVIFIVLLAVAGCGSSSSAANQGPIRIGASLSLTGSYATEAIGAYDAMKLWTQDVNAQGGLLGRQVQLDVYDDQSDPAQATRLYTKLITDDKVDLMFGPFSSAVSAPVANVVEKYNFPTVLWGAGADAIFSQGFKNVFQVVGQSSKTFDGYWALMQQAGLKTICLTGEDSESDATDYPVFIKAAEAQGFTIAAEDLYPPNTTSVTSIIAKFKSLNCDVLLDGTYQYDAALLAREAKAQNWNPKMYAFQEGPSDQNWITSMGKVSEYLLGEESWAPTLTTPGNAAFIASYIEEFQKPPDFVGALAYGAGQVLQAAVEKAGSLNKDAIRQNLATLTVQTVQGPYKTGPGGIQEDGGVFVVQVQSGKPEVVWPAADQTAAVKLPVPPWDQRS